MNRIYQVNRKRIKKAAPGPAKVVGKSIFVSMVMSCFNRSHLLELSLESIARQQVNYGIEIVVVNDGFANDNTKEVCQKFAQLNIKYVFSGHRNVTQLISRNPCVPNNIAVKQSSGDVIILTCPEMFHLNDAINRLVKPLESRQNVLSTPRVLYFDRNNLILPKWPSIDLADTQPHLHGNRYPFFMGMWKKEFMDIGGYDEDFANVFGAEDDDLMCRLKKKRMKYCYTESCVLHLWHESCKAYCSEPEARRARAKEMFVNKRAGSIVRNQNRPWGIVKE